MEASISATGEKLTASTFMHPETNGLILIFEGDGGTVNIHLPMRMASVATHIARQFNDAMTSTEHVFGGHPHVPGERYGSAPGPDASITTSPATAMAITLAAASMSDGLPDLDTDAAHAVERRDLP